VINKLNLKKTCTLFVYSQYRWVHFLILLFKYNSFFFNNFLIDIVGYEAKKKPGHSNLTTLNYVFFFYNLHSEVIISSTISSRTSVNSISKFYKNANWAEREFQEMHGINFINKDNSRRLLLDYSFTGYPLMKFFTVTGYFELFFNFNLLWVFYTPLKFKDGYEFNTFFDY
jgi:NADH:ubiquinone oxidoreductase subunit C